MESNNSMLELLPYNTSSSNVNSLEDSQCGTEIKEENGTWTQKLSISSEFASSGLFIKIVMCVPVIIIGLCSIIIVVLVLLWDNSSNAQLPSNTTSPCPEIFQYDTESREEPGKWKGELTVSSEFALSGLWIKVFLDNPATLLGSTFSAIETEDNMSYLFTAPSHILMPSTTVSIPFFVQYSEVNPAPHLQSIRVNGRTVCPIPENGISKVSPCPGIVVYNDTMEPYDNKDFPDRWYGKLVLNTEVQLTGVWVRITLDTPSDLFGAKFGEIESTDNKNFLIKAANYILEPGVNLEIPVFVKYSPLSSIPIIQTVLLNGRVVCGPLIIEIKPKASDRNQDAVETSLTKSVLQPSAAITEGPTSVAPMITPTAKPMVTSEKFVLPKFSCGIREFSDRIFFGTPSSIEQYPWHGVIFHQNEYVCGLSLISPYHALTAAHCFYNKYKLQVEQKSISLFFGLSNLRKFRRENVQGVKIAQIFKYPKYEFHIPMFDIAVVKFDRMVEFNERVRPVCLWPQEGDLRAVENTTGVVTGFGLTEVGTHSDQLLWGRILVVDSETCREIDQNFYGSFLTKFSFCAGNLSQSTVCHGDSGGGLFFQKPGTEIWQIRGITSTSKPKGVTCDNKYYAIFTDVAKFSDWIQEQMQK